MIQATLIFILGFLSAVFLAVLVAPAIWRRAVALTRRRIEAALPLTMNEIRADKDAVRAEYAMATRKLEVTVRSLREQIAAQSVEVDRIRDDERRIMRERDEKAEEIAALRRQEADLRAALQKGEEEIARLAGLIAERDRLIGERDREIEKLGAMYDEASFNASSRQIDLVAQESKIEKLEEEASALREQYEEAQAELRQMTAQAAELDQSVRAEKRRIVALERKLEKLTATLSDREEKLERRERDLERLRAKLGQASNSGRETAAKLAAEQDRAVRLREELAVQARELKAMRAVQEKKLRAANGEGGGDAIESALLRERINDLAAEVVSLTARLEGPDSEIDRLLAAAPAAGGTGDGAPSLAERIRTLQKATGRG